MSNESYFKKVSEWYQKAEKNHPGCTVGFEPSPTDSPEQLRLKGAQVEARIEARERQGVEARENSRNLEIHINHRAREVEINGSVALIRLKNGVTETVPASELEGTRLTVPVKLKAN